MQVENTVFDLGTGTLIAPVLSGDTITGPGMGVAGSIGILSENNANEPNSVAFGAAGITTISGFQTGIKVDQTVAPSDNKTSTAYIERIRLTGNATGVLIGSGGVLNGDFTNDNSTVTTGTGVVYPGVSQSFALYDHDPGGSFIGPYPDTIKSGDVTLASTSTFASLITGDTGTTTIFSFNQAANYPPAFLPIAPVNGTTTLPNGATYPAGQVVQDGTSGELVIGNGAINGPLQLMFGTNSHLDPNSPANAPVYILDPVDISNRNTVELVAKVGAANQSKGVLFALADITGNLALWTVDLTGLNTTAYSTISLNLSGLAIPLDLGGGGSGNFDLSKVVGFAILGDEGLLNGQLNVPFDLHLDAIQAGSIQNSVLKVNGSVNLGGANFNGSIGADYVSAPSHTYTIIDNDGTMDAVTGTFAGIADGATVTLGTEDFKISYHGGDGNDVTLTDIGPHVVTPNNAPSGADKTVATQLNTDYVFTVADFGFSDPLDAPPNNLQAVKITTLPSVGTLKDNNVAVTAGQFVSAADIAAGKLTFSPVMSGSGSPYASFTFQVQDDGGTAGGGVDLDPTPNTITINVTGAKSVAGRFLFYNFSKYDSNTAGVDDSDDGAIATDKTPYFAGSGVIGPQSMSAYAYGINGIMVDIAGGASGYTASDFTFKIGTGTSNDPSTWATAPAPSTVVVRPGKGVGGSDRVEIIWSNFAMTDKYLQVTVRGNDAAGGNDTNTGLAASDTFYFGSMVADTFDGTPPAAFSVNVNDEIGVRLHYNFNQPLTNVYDYTKDGLVNINDELLARGHYAFLLRINIPAAGPLAAPAAAEDSSGSGGASALALAVPSQSAAAPKLPGWISSRLAKVDLNSGPIAALFTRLAEADTPRSHAILTAADRIADALGLDDSLLDSLLDDLDEVASS